MVVTIIVDNEQQQIRLHEVLDGHGHVNELTDDNQILVMRIVLLVRQYKMVLV